MKIVKLVVTISMFFMSLFNTNVFAVGHPDVGYTMEEINDMTDDEFVEMIVEFNKEADKEGYNVYQKQAALSDVGVEFY